VDAGRLRVLLVEDDTMVRGAIAELLRHHGYDLREAGDGRAAIDLFTRAPADIVITDVRMPGMDGLEVLARLKRIAPEVCVVVMTGYGSEDTAIRAMRSGASNYFKKPVDFAEFAYALGVLSDLVRSRREHRFDPRLLVREARTLRLGTDLDEIYPVIRELTASAAVFPFDLEAVRIGLLEMLTNAIEHGSLGITSAEKRAALRGGTLRELYARRAAEPPWRDRTVLVEAELTPERLSFRVEDQGDGFDWRALPDPGEPEGLLGISGRGVTVARLCMDELTFSGRGNEVLIAKRARPAATPGRPALAP
jgi:DNA-binding response OmpR family regulator